jgi:hypothetical protein
MPFEMLAFGPVNVGSGNPKRVTVEPEVLLAVMEVVPESSADVHAVIRCYGHVPRVIQPVHIRAQQETVIVGPT